MDGVVKLVTVHAASVDSWISVQLLGSAHLLVSTVLSSEQLLVSNVGVGVLGPGEVETVDDHVVVQLLALVDALHRVQLILHLRLEVSSQLLLLPPPLVAVDEDERHQGEPRHDDTESGDEDTVASSSITGHLGPGQLVVLGVHLPRGQDLTHGAGVLGQADAGEGVVAILAESSVQTRVWITLIHLLRAVFTSEARSAGAVEIIDSILTQSTISTGLILAVVVVVLTMLPSEPVLTHTLVVVDEGEADALVLTWVGLAQVCHCFTVSSLESWRTRARVSAHIRHARGAILTRIVFFTNIKV